jgi:CDP-diacylglycerol--serine O-phosphatidyltransferase
MANVVTAANLLFGAMSIFLSAIGRYVPAAWIIFFCVIFDIADGKIARASHTSSEFGKEFDSLADLVSFIIAPSVLIFTLNRPEFFLWRLLVCLVAVFCGAFRLARFNSESEDKIPYFFNGLPTPGFGVFLAAGVLIYYRYNLQIEPRIISIAAAMLAIMMVSQVKYPTFKETSLFNWKYLIVFAIILIALFFIPELTVFILCAAYVFVMPFIKRREG